jgi:hypothetical protein
MYTHAGALQGFVDQLIGLIVVPAEQDSEGTKPGYCAQHGVSMSSGPDTWGRDVAIAAHAVIVPRTLMTAAAT